MTTSPPVTRRPPYPWFIGFGALLIAVVAFFRLVSPSGGSGSQLHPLWTLPPFSLTERSGRLITNRDLDGKIWVADFVYTTCPGPCPLVSTSLARIQAATAGDLRVQLVTFTVDPKTDTPAVLAKYADKYGADPNRWWFLTGPEKPLDSLIQDGFRLAVQDNRETTPPQPGPFTVDHSTSFALVDGTGNVRGFFNSLDPDDCAKLLDAIHTLEKESP